MLKQSIEAPLLEPIQAPEGRYGYTYAEAAIVGDMLYLPSIGEGINFTDDEGADLAAEELAAWLACSQSLYWAQQGGVNCSGLELLYFYHSNYLGSVGFVTDMRGEAYQFFLNTPWGENIENQFARNYTAFSSRFRFNDSQEQSKTLIEGSVRSTEWEDRALRNRPVAYFSEGASLPRWPGDFYYGARYYDPRISVWLSVDPLASEAAHLTPYHFVSNSPLNRIDPDGRKDLIFDSNGDYTGEIQNNNFFHNLFFGARGIVQDGNGNVLAKFTFNDQNYVDRFENLNPGEEGYLSGINRFNKYDLFMEAVVSNPVKDIKDKNLNDFELLKEIYSESALSLDFYDSGELLLGIPNDRLSVIDGVAYDSYDAGNYAWGVSMRKLGIRYLTAAAGSQFNGFWNGKYDNSQWTYGVDPYLDRITWTGDSRADQKAIRKGFFRK